VICKGVDPVHIVRQMQDEFHRFTRTTAIQSVVKR
jgi:hypothetical protein